MKLMMGANDDIGVKFKKDLSADQHAMHAADFVEYTREDVQRLAPHILPYLKGSEVVHYIKQFHIEIPQTLLPPIDALKRLAHAPVEEEIGDFGPCDASTYLEGSENIEETRSFECLFGRDSLIMASTLMEYYPKLAKATLLKLAQLQGIKNDPVNEEEVGKILHEHRLEGDVIRERLTREYGWGWPYYGSVDSTPLFITTLLEYARLYGSEILDEKYINKEGNEKSLKDALFTAVSFVSSKVEQNPEGFLEFKRSNLNGLNIQSWRDSFDSHSHRDGSLANIDMPIASAEVQALAYDALMKASKFYNNPEYKLENEELAFELHEKAQKLKASVIKHFWVTDDRGNFFALGGDRDANGNLRILDVKTSSMGRLLNSEILEGDEFKEMRDQIVKSLLGQDMLNGNGIRTMSNLEARSKPGGYHTGSVWPYDSFLIALGFRKYGYEDEFKLVVSKISALIKKYKRYSEISYGGEQDYPYLTDYNIIIHDHISDRLNTIEMIGQQVQGWTVATAVWLHKNNLF